MVEIQLLYLTSLSIYWINIYTLDNLRTTGDLKSKIVVDDALVE